MKNALLANDVDTIKCVVEDRGLSNTQKNFLLAAAAQDGYLDIVRYLIEIGTDIESRVKRQATPLFLAAQNGYVNVIQYLGTWSMSGLHKCILILNEQMFFKYVSKHPTVVIFFSKL